MPLVCFFLGEITLHPPEVSTDLYFFLQSFKCDTLPLQTFKLWQFNHFDIFFPKIPPSHFLFLFFYIFGFFVFFLGFFLKIK